MAVGGVTEAYGRVGVLRTELPLHQDGRLGVGLAVEGAVVHDPLLVIVDARELLILPYLLV